jgi:zinc protease
LNVDLPLERHTLDNGLRLVLHRDPNLPLVTVNLWYHVGSKNERPGRTGFAHLFEHMLFQGSEHVDTNDHFRLLQQVGGVANGSTWFDRTNYYETLPSNHLELGLWLESDRMGFLLPAMTGDKLETQRSVVMNERRQRMDNQPYGLAFERLQALRYPSGSPYRWPVIGYMEDIEAATLEDVQDFFRTYYLPNNAVLTLAGDFDPGEARELVERYFGPIPRGADPPRPRLVPADLSGEVREELPDDVRLPRLYVAFSAPPFGERGWYVADLLASVWTGGKSSLLYHELVYRRELAQDVAAWISPMEAVGSLMLVATARAGVSPEELEAALFEQLGRVRSEPLAPERVEAARNRILTELFEDLQRLEERADLLSLMTTYLDRPERLATEPERYADITADDLRAYAEEHGIPEDRAVLVVVPGEDP